MTALFAWLVARLGKKGASIAIIAILVLLVAGVCLLVSQCHPRNNTAQKQAEQTTASGEAITEAAAIAVNRLQAETVTEKDIDNATASAQTRISGAADPDDVRGAVLASVCGSAGHRNDPACRVQ